ncbi:MAG: tetratricopeptide repeat protein [Limisphaerales bacterium]
MESETKPSPGIFGISVGILSLLLGASALIMTIQERKKAKDEISRLEGQLAELSAAAGKLGMVEERVNWLQVKNDDLAQRSVTAQQLTNIVQDLRYTRAGLTPLIEKLDAIGAGTNAPHELRAQTERLAVLEARLASYEAKAVPYTSEELSLLQLTQAGLHRVDLQKLGELNALAERAYASGQPADAERHYLEMLKINPKDHLTLANLATVQMELNKLTLAQQNLDRVLAGHPNDSKSVMLMGLVKLRQNNLDGAMVQLARATELDSENAETHNYLGIVLSQKGQRKAAETAFRRALKLDPKYAIAHYNLAVHYVTAKPPAGGLAKRHYEKAVQAGHPRQARVEKLLQDAL